MGGAFAALLARAGRDVVVVDTAPDRVAQAIEHGCRAAADVGELVRSGANPILISLATEAAFEGVIDELVRAGADHRPGTTVVETSTLAPDTKRRARDRLALAGMDLLDCPVSGTGAQAAVGDVVVYAGGSPDLVDAVEPVLLCFARRVHRVGSVGDAATIKLLSNLLVGIHNTAAAELVAFAQRSGVDPMAAIDAIADGAGQSRMLEVRGPTMARGDYGYGASVDLFRKDLALIEALADDVGAVTPLLDVVVELYERAASIGLGDAESAAVHRVYVDR